MGIIVECNGQELWSPSLGVGNLFFTQIKALESVLGLESGVDSFIADTLEIDAPTFDAFLQSALQKLATTNNAPLFALSAGCVEIAIALNTKITGRWISVPEQLQPLLERAKSVMNPIAFQKIT